MKQSKPTTDSLVTAVVANQAGEIFELEGFAAVGMAASHFAPLTRRQTIPLPHGSELMLLPDRRPVLFNMEKSRIETLAENPYAPGEPIYAVAAFNSPGHTISYVSAYRENTGAGYLPLFSYGAVGWQGNGFRSAAICVDRERRQDLRLMKQERVLSGIRKMRRKMPDNRLRAHLEKCALKYGCPAGKNFFLGRFEAPLPTSRKCNAACLGCLSLQKTGEIPESQQRISFTPSPEEIAEVALTHIERVKKGIVSFGQGCEGDPLLAADVIGKAIALIRSKTSDGTINMNTNGSLPSAVQTLCRQGLDSIRISVNSVRKKPYHAYFRPKGYEFSDVLKSIDTALELDRFVSINYLNCPGFTDTPEELEAFLAFVGKHPIHMIQWRNLNFDPVRYWHIMSDGNPPAPPVGMATALKRIKKAFPKLKYGYFNPSVK